MLFNSFVFFVFLIVILPIFYALKTKESKNIFLLLSSYFFYGYWDWRFCSLLMLSTVIDYFVGKKLYATEDQNKRKRLLYISLISNLGMLVCFKYFNFFVDSFDEFSRSLGCELDFLHLEIILPVGISFYTFQTLSYTIDIYRGRLKATNHFIDFALFVSFFPQLVAGPIERAVDLLPQLTKKLNPTKQQIKSGIVLIVLGLFKKVMIGDTAGRYVDYIFADMEYYHSAEALCALILFSIQIYADFSGYSSIARGTAKLLGVELMKNFEQPYLSRNITEFWRRWHISLSSWLKDYLYISLGGNRKGASRTYINLMLTMLLGGLWHGASWNFMIWGGFHGLYLIIHKKIMERNNQKPSATELFKLSHIPHIILTYVLVLITWLFFRATSWDTTLLFIDKMIHWQSSEYSMWFVKITAVYMTVLITFDLIENLTRSHSYLLKLKQAPIRYGVTISLFVLTLAYMFQTKTQPFVYFAF